MGVLFSLALALDPQAQLLGEALNSPHPYQELRELCDDIGHRLSGSPQLEQAVVWAAEEMKQDGLDVRLADVQVPYWVRGQESLRIVGGRELEVLGLGRSVATPKKGLKAQVLVVSSFEELDQRAEEAKGKMVVWNVPFTSYGETVQYRSRGASAAAKHGAVASLVRSVTPVSLNSAHTGAMRYDETLPKIPTAAITIEDATWLARRQAAGHSTELHLKLSATFREDALSHNVIAEIRGASKPDEVVVVGCHLDSWDVGQGAQDDGAGCVAAMEVGRLLKTLPEAPARTVQIVLYTNEENGLRGGKTYAEKAQVGEGRNVVAAMEADTGAGRVTHFRVDARSGDDTDEARRQATIDWLTPNLHWFEHLGVTSAEAGYSGADIGPTVAQGALGFGTGQVMDGYWPIHHTHADTFDKIDESNLQQMSASMAILTWLLATEENLP